MADSDIGDIDAEILRADENDTDVQKKRKGYIKNRMLGIGSNASVSSKMLLVHMLIFHYVDVIFLMNVGIFARLFVYMLVALVYFPF